MNAEDQPEKSPDELPEKIAEEITAAIKALTPMAIAYLRNRGLNTQMVEDLMSATAVRIIRHVRKDPSPINNFKGYFYTAFKHELVDQLRAEGDKRRFFSMDADPAEVFLPPGESPEKDIIAKIDREILMTRILNEKWTDTERQIIRIMMLAESFDLRARQVAHVLTGREPQKSDLKSAAVEINKVMAKLRSRVKRYLHVHKKRFRS